MKLEEKKLKLDSISSVSLEKVKGHAGIHWNEMADKLACDALK